MILEIIEISPYVFLLLEGRKKPWIMTKYIFNLSFFVYRRNLPTPQETRSQNSQTRFRYSMHAKIRTLKWIGLKEDVRDLKLNMLYLVIYWADISMFE